MTEELEKGIKETYTSDRYYKLFLFWWAMVGEGFVAADALVDEFDMDDEVFSWDLDVAAENFLQKLQELDR